MKPCKGSKKPVQPPVPAQQPSPEDIQLRAAQRHSWYILNALMNHIRTQQKAVDEAKVTLAKRAADTPDDVMIASLRSMVEHVEQSIREHQRALDALRQAGFD